MPNAFVYVALLGWPAIVFVLCRILPPAQAVVASILGGYLLLPFGVGFDFPLLPALNKDSIPALSVLILLPLVGKLNLSKRTRSSRQDFSSVETQGRLGTAMRVANTRSQHEFAAAPPFGLGGVWIEWVFLALALLGPALTVMQNSEPFINGRTFLRGLGAYDGFSLALDMAAALLPYFLARRYLCDPDKQLLLLKGLAIAGLLYSALALVEMRLSPQISRWVYGYLSQSFSQAMRSGGYRPVVFLQHGLWLAIFFAMAVIGALAVWKRQKVTTWLFSGLWLLVVLAFSRSLGAFAIALACIPIILFVRPPSQVLFAAAVGLVIVLYPVMRATNIIPVSLVVEIADSISPDRGESLVFRLKNEDVLLARANEKPLSGWGGWGRSRIFDASGKDTSVTDGAWIIILGVSGWLGYLGQFGLLTAPILLLAMGQRRRRATPTVAGLCVLLCANLVDLIPNATLTPITWLVAGALMGGLRAANHSSTPISNVRNNPGKSNIYGYSRSRDTV